MSSTVLKWSIAVLIISGAILLWLSLQLAGRDTGVDTADPEFEEAPVLQPENQAVVAVSSIESDEVIEADDVSLESVGVAPESGFVELEDVVGRRAVSSIGTGEPILERHFRDGGVMASNVPEGMRAMAVSVSDVSNVAGFIEPGDRVDVVVFLSSGQEVSSSQARILLSNVSVLAFGEESVDTEERSSGPHPDVRTAVLAVPEELVPRVKLGVSSGTVSLTLRGSAGDLVAVSEDGESEVPGSELTGEDSARMGELTDADEEGETLPDLSGDEPEQPAPRTRVHRGGETEEIIH